MGGGSFPPKREGKIGGERGRRGEREREREREREGERERERERGREREGRVLLSRHGLLLHAWSSITYSITTNLSIAFVVSIVFYGNGSQFQTSIPSYIELPINAHCQEYIAIGNNNKQYRVCGDRKWAWPPIFRASACSFFFYFSPNLKSWMNVYRSQYKHNYVGLMKLLFSRL